MNKKVWLIAGIMLAVLALATVVYTMKPSQGGGNDDTVSSASTAGSSMAASSQVDSTFSQPGSEVSSKDEEESNALYSEEAEKTLANFGVMGQEYTIHSRHYRQGEAKVEDAPNLGWNGDVTVLLKSAEILDYDPDTFECDQSEMWNSELEVNGFSNPCVLKLDLTFTNKNAQFSGGVRYEFNADMFKLSGYEDLIPENYENAETFNSVGVKYGLQSSSFDKAGDGDDYYCFELPEGESLDFTLMFCVDRSYFDQQTPFLAISNTREVECGILLDKLS